MGAAFEADERTRAEMSALMRRFTLHSGRRVVGAWWLFGLLGGLVAALCPEPVRTVISGILAVALFVSWIFVYPLLLVFFTPHATTSQSVRMTAVITVAAVLVLLVIERWTEVPAMFGLISFMALTFLFSIAAHVLGTAEHRLGLYGPLDSFFAVVALYAWPFLGFYVQNRLRRVATLDANMQQRSIA